MEKELGIPLEKEKDILKIYFNESLKKKYGLNKDEEIKNVLKLFDINVCKNPELRWGIFKGIKLYKEDKTDIIL